MGEVIDATKITFSTLIDSDTGKPLELSLPSGKVFSKARRQELKKIKDDAIIDGKNLKRLLSEHSEVNT